MVTLLFAACARAHQKVSPCERLRSGERVRACGGGNQLKNSHKAAARAASFVWVVGIQFISRNLLVTFVFVWAGAQCFILSAGAGRTSVPPFVRVFPFSGNSVPRDAFANFSL